jgi:uncharacterized membrane protein YcaP (DUF421 family)
MAHVFEIGVKDMFVLSIPWLEKVLRAVLVYLFLLVGLRLAGKRQLAQLNAFDLVVLLSISNTVQNAIIGDDNSVTGGVIGASTLLAVNYLFVWLAYRNETFDEIVEGKPTLLIDKGVLCEEAMRKQLVTLLELEMAAHRQGFRSLEQIERAELDPGGAILFLAKEPSLEEKRHAELMRRLDEMSLRLEGLGARA